MEASALQKSMEMETSKCMKESEDEKTTRKRKRKKFDRFVFLPDDILLDILKRVPDVFLRYKAKYVCRRWLDIITNRILLDHASYILQKMRTSTTRTMDVGEEGQGLQVKEQYLDIPHKGIIRSWCKEFLLISGSYSLYVYNLITKEGSYLPECDASCGGHNSSKCGMALSFDPFKGIYKVVHLFIGRTMECHILIWRRGIVTRAFCKWKKIQVPCTNEGQYIWGEPVSVQGRYLNWRIHGSSELVSVDTVKEEISIISLPEFSDRGEYVCTLFVMGGFLGLFDGVSRGKVEIWVLKDFHRVTWEKLQSITDNYGYFDKYPGKIIYYRIYGMLSKKRYIILKSRDGMYSYDHIHHTHIQYDDESCVVYSTGTKFKVSRAT